MRRNRRQNGSRCRTGNRNPLIIWTQLSVKRSFAWCWVMGAGCWVGAGTYILGAGCWGNPKHTCRRELQGTLGNLADSFFKEAAPVQDHCSKNLFLPFENFL